MSNDKPLKHTDFEVMDRMAKARGDIMIYPDILGMKRDKKGAKLTVGITNEAMQKLARGYTEVGPSYVAVLVVLNYEEFERHRRALGFERVESEEKP